MRSGAARHGATKVHLRKEDLSTRPFLALGGAIRPRHVRSSSRVSRFCCHYFFRIAVLLLPTGSACPLASPRLLTRLGPRRTSPPLPGTPLSGAPRKRHGGARAENPRPYGYNPDAWKSRGRAVPPEAWRAIERLGANESSFTGTPSGLYFLDTKEGSGSRCCDEGVEVAVGWSIRRASGRLIDASRGFTSALTAGEELRFTPKRLILGIRGVGMRDDVVEAFREGVVGMREGGGRRLVVPPALGWYYPEQRPFPAEEARQQDLNVHRREPLLVDIVLRTVASAPAPPP
ncbi:unnamed protein product [Prorocentrum cordatum]|uniref:peptidylprolyl isomerase n=1 Tax=Prorocentrum cordatum TaxID=2364126 RepID=A0ABN9UQ29_9DINO|nr:unnamed protein product [Polarella glacialis]